MALYGGASPAPVASGMCAAVTSSSTHTVIEIDRWERSGWEAHICGVPPNDFPLEPGRGYFVRAEQATVWRYESVTSVPVALGVGWKLVASNETVGAASSVCVELNAVRQGTVIELDRWIDGGWEGHRCGLPVNDFVLEAWQGYFIRMASPAT